MTPGNERAFYDAVILICAVMALVNLARTKSRGNSAIFMGAAFLVLGATVYAYTSNFPMPVVYVGGAIVFVLLAADMVFRVRRETKE